MPRLIDADALKSYWERDDISQFDYTEDHFIESIDNAPTVDATKMIHGRTVWKDRTIGGYRYKDITCACCGATTSVEIEKPFPGKVPYCSECGKRLDDRFMNYCPNCGAKMEDIKLILQPSDSNLCGQTCVAMLAGISLEESIKVFGTRGATTTKQVIRALRDLGIKCGDRLLAARKTIRPVLCMAVLHFEWTKSTHWTIWDGDHFIDPGIGIIKEYQDGVRVTSYLPIY